LKVSRFSVPLAAAAALALVGRAAAQDTVPVVADTVTAAAQDTAAVPRVRLRFPGARRLAFRAPRALDPGGILGERRAPGLVAAQWETETRTLLARNQAARRQERLLSSLGLRIGPQVARRRRTARIPRPEEFLEPPEEETEAARTFRAVAAYADLGLDLRARIEVKLDRLRNARCTAAEINDPTLGCQGGFPTPSFDEEFRVRAGGIVSDRVHVNVDFDSEREFSANNNINVFYQGLEDEILRRVEVGNVTFRAPNSRFITAAVPGNSFGVQAEAQVGPLEFRTILAQQKGSAIRARDFTVGDATTQPVDIEARDLDFEQSRFFFVVDPRTFPSYPQVDVLNIQPETLPSDLQIANVRIYRLRAQSGQLGNNVNLGGIDAIAVRRDSPQRVGPFSWELLVEGQDYYLDPSAAWFALASRLGTDDFLAVSYVTLAGDTVGTFPSINGVQDTLELIHEPRRGPEVPTFFYEMRNAYRLAGQNIDRATLTLILRLGTSETPLDAQGTYLSRLGLALATDASKLDDFNRVFPRERDPGGGLPIRELFVMFPHLQPLADSVRLLQGERNDSLYRTPAYLLRTQGPASRFTLELHYEATGAGDRSNLSLGTIQVRAGSERLFIGDRLLVRGRDYDIDYALGQVTFLSPDALFTGVTRVRAQFEENQLFDEAPKTILGLSTTYTLPGVGEISALGIFQRERTVSTRPILGFEPEAGFIGGLSTELAFRSEALTRALNGLPFLSTTVPSALTVNGEVALSLPNANRAGAAFIEDFDRESALGVPLTDRRFQRGSRPSSGLGLPATHLGVTGEFDDADAVPMVWQNLVLSAGGNALQFGPQDIDTTIALVGTGVSVETVLWLTLKPDTVGGLPDPITGLPRWVRPHTPGPRWRSMTQALGGGSGVGADLSRVEFLEFWVLENALRTARDQGAYLVFDFGTVFEDAVAFAPQSFDVSGADTTFAGFQFVGTGRLDTEKDSLTNVYNALLDDVGIHGDRPDSLTNTQSGDVLEQFPLCDLQGLGGLTVFPLGDLIVRCTRGNGFFDTEDLDGDNRLDVNVGTLQEDFVRYVFPVGSDEFFVRDGATLQDAVGRDLKWRLYRIPFRADTLRVGQPNLRQVEAMRLTFVAPGGAAEEQEFWISLARMRLVGAPWLKRGETPLQGIGGAVGTPQGEVIASIVTTENTDLGYTPPPGVVDLPERVDVGLTIGQVQINEKSLRLLATDLSAGERAEAFIRFAGEADKNFLNYRELRVWARGRGVGWNEDDLEFFIKVGRDEHNFYLYRTPARSDTWEPEVVVSLERWLALRAQAEAAWLSGAPPSGAAQCGGDSTAYVACDGPYLVHVQDPATSPPNLARVSEVAVGMFRAQDNAAIQQAELWVDEIRLTSVIDDAGLAAALDVRFSAADLAEVNLSLTRRDGKFRQLDEDPRYVTDAATRIGALFRLDKLLPESWGLAIPFTVQHQRTSADPFYIRGTDVRADALTELRRPEGSATRLQVNIRRARRGRSFFARAFLDPVTVTATRDNARNVTSLSSFSTRNRQYRIQYSNTAGPRTIRGAPGFLIKAVQALPAFIRESEFGKALRRSRLRWNPYQLTFSSTLTNNLTERFVFRVPVELVEDSALRPLPSVVRTWRNTAGIELRPYSSLTLRVNYSSTRDLQNYGDSSTVGKLLELERRKLFGTDVGFERLRTLTTAFSVSPAFTSWLRPRFSLSTNFTLNRNPNRQDAVRLEGDTAGAFKVPETLQNSRRQEWGAALDLARLARGIGGDSGLVTALFRGILPADFSYTRELRSSFDRSPFDAGFRYHLAWGGLTDFREQEGVLATAAGDVTTVLISGGVRLPLAFQVRATYRDLENLLWQRRGAEQTEVRQLSREWPSVNVIWSYTPPRMVQKLVTAVTAQAQYRVLESSRTQPSFGTSASELGTEVRTENNSKFIAPSLTLAWTRGVTTSGRYTYSISEAVTSGNVTESERREWGATVNFAFRSPRFVSLRNRIQTTLGFSSSVLAVCLLRTGTDECRTVSDSRRQQLDARLDTGFSSTLRGGLSFSYIITDQRHTSQKLSQIVFTIFGDITLRAGQVR
jgi:hypothetical protein